MKLSKDRIFKTLNTVTWLSAGLCASYTAVAVLYPARALDGAWRDRLLQTCSAMKPRCDGLAFEPTLIRDYWHGQRVHVQVTASQASSVQQALAGASGPAANRYLDWTVDQLGPPHKS